MCINVELMAIPANQTQPIIRTKIGLFNRKQIADYIGVSERTISNMMRQRRIPVIKIGKSVRFDPSKVRKALDKYEIEAI